MQRKPSVGMEIRITSHLLRRQLERLCEGALPAGERTTGIQNMVLHYLAERDGGEPVCQRDIEAAFSIRRSSVTAVLQLMEKNGLLRRESVPGDARLKRLVLTSLGRSVHRKIEAGIHTLEARAVTGLTDAEVEQFFSLMGKIRKNLEE